jgi:hypothetical protein
MEKDSIWRASGELLDPAIPEVKRPLDLLII